MLLGRIIIGAIIGTVMGSFGLVLLDRWDNLKSVWTGRSMCLDCKHPLGVKDLVPLVSYMSTGGKCRYCGVSIPITCPIMELVMGVIFALTSWWVLTTQSDYQIITMIAWWLINRSMVLLVVHDHNTQYLHWTAWIVAMVVAIGYVIGRQPNLIASSLWSSIIIGAIFLLIFISGYIVHWVKFGTWDQGFGFGDVLVALLLGWLVPMTLGYETLNLIGEGGILILVQLILGYLVISSTLGLLYRGYQWSRGSQEIEIAFLPAMIVGFWIYLIIIQQFGLFI